MKLELTKVTPCWIYELKENYIPIAHICVVCFETIKSDEPSLSAIKNHTKICIPCARVIFQAVAQNELDR